MMTLQPRRTLERILHELPIRSLRTWEERKSLCDYIGRCVLPDVRMQVWNLSVLEQESFVVQGYTSTKLGLKALVKAAEVLNCFCDIRNVILLPDPELGTKRFGLVVSEECPLFTSFPNGKCLDTATYGEYLVLLRRHDSHSLVQRENGYVGWVRNVEYRSIELTEWYEWIRRARAIFLRSWNQAGITIPKGAELPVLPSGEVQLPTGSSLRVDAPGIYFSTQSEQQQIALTALAKALVGTPYQHGGATAKKIDCSGLISFVYRCIGILLSRDADQQSLMGRLVAFPGATAALRAGDLLFFSGEYGGISHVAMALNSEQLFHADVNRGVNLTRMENEPVLQERFLFAKRIIR